MDPGRWRQGGSNLGLGFILTSTIKNCITFSKSKAQHPAHGTPTDTTDRDTDKQTSPKTGPAQRHAATAHQHPNPSDHTDRRRNTSHKIAALPRHTKTPISNTATRVRRPPPRTCTAKRPRTLQETRTTMSPHRQHELAEHPRRHPPQSTPRSSRTNAGVRQKGDVQLSFEQGAPLHPASKALLALVGYRDTEANTTYQRRAADEYRTG